LGFWLFFSGYGDFNSHKNKTAIGKERIGRHLGNMMGGTIAVITAVLVANSTNPFLNYLRSGGRGVLRKVKK